MLDPDIKPEVICFPSKLIHSQNMGSGRIIMRRFALFQIAVLLVFISLPQIVYARVNNVDYLIGDWTTSDGTILSFSNDGMFVFNWGILGVEEGDWYAESTSDDSFVIEMDGSSILSMMSMLYGTTDSNYHFEVLRCNDDNFYLVQVYGSYTPYSSPCKLGFTRKGAERNFSISAQDDKEENNKNVDGHSETLSEEHTEDIDMSLNNISVEDGDGYVFNFDPGEGLEDLVLSMESDSYNPRLAHFLSIMARSIYHHEDGYAILKKNLTNLGFDGNDKDHIEDFENDLTVAYSIAKKRNKDNSEIVIITIEGSYGWSWINNAAIGLTALNGFGKHGGFELNANQIFNDLKKLIGDIKKTDVTYVITGHSQGAATANLLSVMLHDAGVSQLRVYNYNFACPNVACLLNPQDWNPAGANHHNNIFNIGNIEDLVTFLPSNLIKAFTPRLSALSTWGKFGRTYWFYPESTNQSPVGHDMVHYVRELEKENPLSSYVTYNGIAISNIKRVLGIHCPVNLSVYDKNDTLIAEVIYDKTVYHTDDVEPVIFIDNDEKYICVPTDKTYEVCFDATDDGSMTYEISDVDFARGEIVEEKVFDAVDLYKGKEMYSKLLKNANVSEIELKESNNHLRGEVSVGFIIICCVIFVLAISFVFVIIYRRRFLA